MNYKNHLRKGYVAILKDILRDISDNGMDGDSSLEITFGVKNSYVTISERIKWPEAEEMKVYLTDGSFEDLRVCDTFFEMILYFDDKEEYVKIPYPFVRKIEDASNGFEMNFSLNDESNFYVTDENIINIDFEKKQ